MDIIYSSKPFLAVCIASLASILIMASRGKPNLREAWSVLGAAATFLTVLSMTPEILAGKTIECTPFVILPGISFKFRVDALGMLFATISSFLWIVVSFYNIGYMRALDEHAQTRYYHCFAVAIVGAVGVAFSGNLFSFYLFYELITIYTYPLVAHHQDAEAWEGGRKYMVYLTGTAKAFLLPAIVLTYVMTGTLDFPMGIEKGMFPADANPWLVTLTYIFYIAGLTKAAIMPLHNWLPSAMVAPTPVSALLHAVAVVKAGVFCICRVMLSVFGVNLLDGLNLGLPTAIIACITIITASVIALTKDDLKARLAYSTVSQLSYVVLGVALLTPQRNYRRLDPYRQPRFFQDYPLHGRRGHLRGHAHQKDQRAERRRPANAFHHGRLRDCFLKYDRGASGLRFCHQMVLDHGGPGGQRPIYFIRPPGQHHSQHRVFRPDPL